MSGSTGLPNLVGNITRGIGNYWQVIAQFRHIIQCCITHTCDGIDLCAHIQVVRKGARAEGLAVVLGGVDDHQGLRVRDPHGPAEQEAVGHAEYGGHGTDTDAQRDNGDGQDPRGLAESAYRELQVIEQVVHGSPHHPIPFLNRDPPSTHQPAPERGGAATHHVRASPSGRAASRRRAK